MNGRLQTDILVLGGGAAALMAAIAAAEKGMAVVVATKAGPFTSSTVWSDSSFEMPGGVGSAFAAPVAPEDSPEIFLADLITAGQGLAEERQLACLAQGSLPMLRRLQRLGVPFQTDAKGEVLPYAGPGHSWPRLCVSSLGTGRQVIQCLRAEAKRLGLTFMKRAGGLALHCYQERVVGARLAISPAAEILDVEAKATVLATGGVASLYSWHTSPPINSGDGIYLAYEAGAKLIDMEFHSPMLVAQVGGRAFGISTAALKMGEFVTLDEQVLRNPRYRPLAPLVLDTAPAQGPTVGTWRLKKDQRETFSCLFPNTNHHLRQHGLKPEEGLPMVMAGHYLLGGVKVDTTGATTLPGLFAGGEVAAKFLGASRLVGTGISQALISGELAGKGAASFARKAKRLPIKTKGKPLPGTHSLKGKESLREALQNIIISRDRVLLEQALKEFEKAPWPQPTGDPKVVSYLSLLTYGSIHVKASLAREETRGEHIRRDFPSPDPRLLGRFTFSKDQKPRFEPI